MSHPLFLVIALFHFHRLIACSDHGSPLFFFSSFLPSPFVMDFRPFFLTSFVHCGPLCPFSLVRFYDDAGPFLLVPDLEPSRFPPAPDLFIQFLPHLSWAFSVILIALFLSCWTSALWVFAVLRPRSVFWRMLAPYSSASHLDAFVSLLFSFLSNFLWNPFFQFMSESLHNGPDPLPVPNLNALCVLVPPLDRRPPASFFLLHSRPPAF